MDDLKKKDMQKLAYEQGVDPLLDRYNTITFKQPKNKGKREMTKGTNSLYTDKEIFQKV